MRLKIFLVFFFTFLFDPGALNLYRFDVEIAMLIVKFSFYNKWFLYVCRWEQTWCIKDGGMNILQAWELGFTGKGVNIVNLDSGIQHTHDDLYLKYDASISIDFVDEDE